MSKGAKGGGGLSKTAKASVRAGTASGPRIRVEHVLVIESYLKPNGAWGLRRRSERREVTL